MPNPELFKNFNSHLIGNEFTLHKFCTNNVVITVRLVITYLLRMKLDRLVIISMLAVCIYHIQLFNDVIQMPLILQINSLLH